MQAKIYLTISSRRREMKLLPNCKPFESRRTKLLNNSKHYNCCCSPQESSLIFTNSSLPQGNLSLFIFNPILDKYQKRKTHITVAWWKKHCVTWHITRTSRLLFHMDHWNLLRQGQDENLKHHHQKRDVRGDQTCEFTADSLNWSLQSKKFSETYLTVSKIGQERLFKGRIFHLKIMEFYQKFAN